MKCKTIKTLRASVPLIATGTLAVCAVVFPEVAHAATGLQAPDRVMNMVPIAIAGVGGTIGCLGAAKALAAWANDGAGHGDTIGRGVKAGIGGAGMVGISPMATTVMGSVQSLSLVDFVHTAVNAVAFTGGSF